MRLYLTSRQNERIKQAAKLRDRSGREESGRLLIEGYRETLRALDNGVKPFELFYCPPLFQGSNEPTLIERCAAQGADLLECAESVFRKLS
ncbi:MAG: RNA methyltransferase, partial [Kiritimatiellia bacterium]|nr:RNA methyltransferase [Kiritimatiellia bacterium]